MLPSATRLDQGRSGPTMCRHLLIVLLVAALTPAALGHASPRTAPPTSPAGAGASSELLAVSGSSAAGGTVGDGLAAAWDSVEGGPLDGTAVPGASAATAEDGGGTSATGATETSPDGGSSTAALSRVAAGLVDVDTLTDDAQLLGTGMVLRSDGLVLTNHHVIDHATQIRVRDIGDRRVYRATVVATDTTHDLALLRLQGAANLTVVSFGDSRTVKVGDPITALGNAGGGNGNPIAATGTVTALDQAVDAQGDDGTTEHLTGMIQGNAPAAPGDSGGPMLNSAGVIIGVTTAGSDNSAGQGQQRGSAAVPGTTVSPAVVDATPINVARAWIEQATKTGSGTTSVPATAHPFHLAASR